MRSKLLNHADVAPRGRFQHGGRLVERRVLGPRAHPQQLLRRRQLPVPGGLEQGRAPGDVLAVHAAAVADVPPYPVGLACGCCLVEGHRRVLCCHEERPPAVHGPPAQFALPGSVLLNTLPGELHAPLF